MIVRRALLAAVVPLALLGVAWPAAAVTFTDPVNFQVKRTWTCTDLGVPSPLGGARFSADGSVLYLVGAANDHGSKLFALPVMRSLSTGEVIAFGNSTPVFTGNNPDPTEPAGLDAGVAFGPSETLFYTYFPVNYLGERAAGGSGEQTFALTALGVEPSVGGVVFSPFRTDPVTAFGRLQVSTGQGILYELPLTPAGNGVFTPGIATVFAHLPQGGTGGIEYVSAGSYAGDLMYASFNFDELHRLEIHPSGLPIDAATGQPTLGTSQPVESLFASGFPGPPLGLTFDATTGNDLFVTTFDLETASNNVLMQIGGFNAPIPTTTSTTIRQQHTTTSSTSTSTSSTTSTSRTTTTSTSSTTSTSRTTTTSTSSTTSTSRPTTTSTSSTTSTSRTTTTSTSSTTSTVSSLCGDGMINPNETCGEPGLPVCGTGQLCLSCTCRQLGDCQDNGGTPNVFDVLENIDILLQRKTPDANQMILCNVDCDTDIDLLDVLKTIDVVLQRIQPPLHCPN